MSLFNGSRIEGSSLENVSSCLSLYSLLSWIRFSPFDIILRAFLRYSNLRPRLRDAEAARSKPVFRSQFCDKPNHVRYLPAGPMTLRLKMNILVPLGVMAFGPYQKFCVAIL